MLWSKNPRLASLASLSADVFWGHRAFRDALEAGHIADDSPVVIADKGFIDRRKLVLSLNREWGVKGEYLSNPNAEPLEIPKYRKAPAGGDVLELGQDVEDYSYQIDSDGYEKWLEQWPKRRFRVHPKVRPPESSLEADFAGARLVVGLNTSALVLASLAGLKVKAYGAHSMAKGIDKGRENALRTLRSYEWSRRDPGLLVALRSTLGEPEPDPRAR